VGFFYFTIKLRLNRKTITKGMESVAIEKITLIAARKMAGLTQRELAQACGVSDGTVSRWEKGIKDPTISQAKRIGEVCGVDYDDIIFLPKVTI
jgi:DNA-binding XRE family transcriptional regulator